MRVPKKYKRYILVMMLQAFLIVLVEVVAILVSVKMMSVYPFIAGLVLCIILAFVLAEYYYSGACFKCKDCGRTFKPKKREFMRSVHIKKGRVFTCPSCSKKVRCKEGYIYGTKFC